MARATRNEYTDTGDKDMIPVPLGTSKPANLFTIKAGATDVYSLKIQMTKEDVNANPPIPASEIITLPDFSNSSGDKLGRVPNDCYAMGLNITTNNSGSIILETYTE